MFDNFGYFVIFWMCWYFIVFRYVLCLFVVWWCFGCVFIMVLGLVFIVLVGLRRFVFLIMLVCLLFVGLIVVVVLDLLFGCLVGELRLFGCCVSCFSLGLCLGVTFVYGLWFCCLCFVGLFVLFFGLFVCGRCWWWDYALICRAICLLGCSFDWSC